MYTDQDGCCVCFVVTACWWILDDNYIMHWAYLTLYTQKPSGHETFSVFLGYWLHVSSLNHPCWFHNIRHVHCWSMLFGLISWDLCDMTGWCTISKENCSATSWGCYLLPVTSYIILSSFRLHDLYSSINANNCSYLRSPQHRNDKA